MTDIDSKKIKAVVFDYGGVIFKSMHWHKDMFVLAKDLRANGYKTAILSNMITPLAWLTHKFPTTSYFSPVVISADVGHSKPRPEIYNILLDRINLKPEQCLFIDDRPENIATARQLGIQVMQVKSPKTTVQELRTIFNL